MMSKNKITAVVFDLGEVLIRLNFDRLFTDLGLGDPKKRKESLEKMGRWQTYDLFERGAIDAVGFRGEIEKSMGKTFTHDQFLEIWNSALVGTIDGVPELLEKLSKKVSLYALTNTNEIHMAHAIRDFHWLRSFKTVFTSFELRARKPEKEIFERMLRQMGCRAQEVLFIDDRMENVEGARKMGMYAELCAESPTDLYKALVNHGLIS